MSNDDHDVHEEEPLKPVFWTFDGVNFLPTSWLGWVLLVGGAIILGLFISFY